LSPLVLENISDVGQIKLGYCSTELSGCGGYGNNYIIKAAIKLPKENLVPFVGKTISQVLVGAVANTSNVSIFLTYNLNSAPFYTQSVSSLTVGQWKALPLTTPYIIEANNDIYIGYQAKLVQNAFGTDDGPANPNGDLVSFSNAANGTTFSAWSHLADLGASCNNSIIAVVSGENLPQYNLSISRDDNSTILVKPNRTFNIEGKVKNNGIAIINSFDINYQIGDAPEQTETVSDISLPNYESYDFSLSVSTPQEGQIPVVITVNNLNGNISDEDNSDNILNLSLLSSNTLSARKFVVEEGTGTWCQWCPRGIVGMQYMNATYPQRFIGIAVHNGDPMQQMSYDRNLGFSGYPSASYNRKFKDDAGADVFEYFYNIADSLSIYTISTVATYQDATKTKADITTSVNSSMSISANANLTYVIIENDVHGTTSGYNQSNVFAGGSNGVMGGFESLPSVVPAAQMYYNEVARGIFPSFKGTNGSVPAQLTANEPASYNYTLTLPTTILNKNNIELITLLLNKTTGEILNASKTEISDASAVENINSINVKVFVANKNLIIKTDKTINGVEIFNAAGQRVLTANATNSIPVNNLSAGIYLAKINIDGKNYMQKFTVK